MLRFVQIRNNRYENRLIFILLIPIRNNTTVEYQILMRQLAMRNEKDHAFINRIQEVIQKYSLKSLWNNQSRKMNGSE